MNKIKTFVPGLVLAGLFGALYAVCSHFELALFSKAEEIPIVDYPQVIEETDPKPTAVELRDLPIKESVRDRNDQEVECLALNIYHEARGSIFVDRAAVTDVVLNRVQDTRYPNKVCDVVKQAKYSKWHLENSGKKVPIRHRCQFSWYCDGRSDYPHDKESWEHAKHIAYNMYYYDEYRGITEGATHYHATYVSPEWASHFQMIGRIGNHIYYRWIN